MSEYPEHEKARQARETGHSDEIGQFIEWLRSERKLVIARWEDKTPCQAKREYPMKRAWKCVDGQLIAGEHNIYHQPGSVIETCPDCEGSGLVDRMVPILVRAGLTIEQLLAAYFEIDLDKLAAEKDQILEDFRQAGSNK
jgi:hypothetical protein